MLVAIALATPFFIFFGYLSDRIGRKWIMLIGILFAVTCYRPIYSKMLSLTDLKIKIELSDKRIREEKNLSEKNGDRLKTIIQKQFYTDGTVLEEKTTEIQRNTIQKIEIKRFVLISNQNCFILFILIFIQIFFVTMVYGPIAAYLVELFPTKIRYTSMSLPYHVGNGIFGGLTPFIATALAVTSPLNGLWYPIIIGIFTFFVGALFLPDKRGEELAE